MEEVIIKDEEEIVLDDDDEVVLSRPTLYKVRGRPRKQSGIYYNKQVLISNRLLKYIAKKRRYREPIGSVLERLIIQNRYNEGEKIHWSTIWK